MQFNIDNFDLDIEEASYVALIKSNTQSITQYTLTTAQSVSVVQEDSNYNQKEATMSKCVEVYYHKTIKTIGWDKLNLQTFNNCGAEIEFYAAGLLEGKKTHKMIKAMYDAMKAMTPADSTADKIIQRLNDHHGYILEKTNDISNLIGFEKTYWTHIKYTYIMLNGMLDGYNSVSNNQLTINDILFVNADGEIMELVNSMSDSRFFRFKQLKNHISKIKNEKNEKNNSKFRFKEPIAAIISKSKDSDRNAVELSMNTLLRENPEMYMYFKETESHCTAVVKLVKDPKTNLIKDLYVGHSTWDDYREMIRIYKEYDFNINDKHSKVQFSSYGGTIYSTDDYYILNNGLVILETSMEILNPSIYKNMKSAKHSLPNFFRIFISNMLGDSIYDWIEVFKKNSSDSYSSQWILTDMNKVKDSLNKKNLDYNSVVVYEQVIDRAGAFDVSELTSQYGYFAGYNRPYFFSQYAGFDEAEQMVGNKDTLHLYSNYSNPRANQIRFLQKYVRTLTDFAQLMRYNNSEKNIKQGSKEIKYESPYQIASRYDTLSADFRKEFGATDSKICNMEMALSMETYAISGPTTDDIRRPWLNPYNLDILPYKWVFKWVKINYRNLRQKKTETMLS